MTLDTHGTDPELETPVSASARTPGYHHRDNSNSNNNLYEKQLAVTRSTEIQRLQLQIRKLREVLMQYELQIQQHTSHDTQLNHRIKELQLEVKRLHELNDSSTGLAYLKNVMIKFCSSTRTEEQDRLLPVIYTVLRLADDEIEEIKTKRVESSASTSRGLLGSLF
jgi:hypothetical protein